MMEHLRDLKSLHLDGSYVTIGSFDGVHLGHQSLIRHLVAAARKAALPSVVLTFYPHPSVVLRGRRPAFYISTPKEKAALLADLGVDIVITQTFDRHLSRVKALEFLELLRRHLGMRALFAGENFALGHGREGNVAFLKAHCEALGFALHVVEPVLAGGEVISSTRVREALRAGDVARVARYLGRPFVIPGEVVAGSARGKQIGIPTANLKVWEERAFPGSGVYACFARKEGGRWQAVTNIGVRPTFSDNQAQPVIEAHLLDFQGDLYGSHLELVFIERLRDERRFPSPEALIQQIQADIKRAREILNEYVQRSEHG
jgi:riboflavin kinase/FMN adenylyltransferase